MPDTAPQNILDETTSSLFSYMDETVCPSLFSNGEVLTKRDPDGSVSPFFGVPSIMKARGSRSLLRNAGIAGLRSRF